MSGLALPYSHVVREAYKRAGEEVDGFYDFRFCEAQDVPGYLTGNPGVQPTQAVFAAKYRMDAPHPDVQHVLPVTDATVTAYRRGDPSVLRALGAELVDAHARFVRDLA